MKRRGWTLVENLTAATCLVVVAASVGQAVGFSAQRTNFEKQRSVVVSQLRSDLAEVTMMAKLGGAPANMSSQIPRLYGVPTGFSMSRTVTEDLANAGRYLVSWEGKWETNREHVVRVESAVTVSLGQTVSINTKAAIGRNYNIPAQTPAALDLEARGILPGDRIRLSTVNEWTAWGSNPPPAWLKGAVAVFSSTNEVLSDFNLSERIPGSLAVVSSPGFVSGDRWSLNSFFPAASFQISSNSQGLRDGVTVTVPAGAKFLFLSVADIPYFTDNRSDALGFGVRITKVGNSGGGEREVLADSATMYGSQGFNGISYGYFEASSPALIDENMWRFQRKNNDAQMNDSSYSVDGGLISSTSATPSAFWTLQWVSGMHPNGGGGRNGTVFHVVARRWTASVGASNALLNCTWRRFSANSSGVDLAIVKNGVAIWTDTFEAGDGANLDKVVNLNLGRVNIGDWYEFRVGPGVNDNSDSTGLNFRLTGVLD